MKRSLLSLSFLTITSTSLSTAQLNDADGDGLSDAWENEHGSHPEIANAAADFDRDHVTAAEEEANHLNPRGVWQATKIPTLPGIIPESTIEINNHGDVAYSRLKFPPVDGNIWHAHLYRAAAETTTDLPDFRLVFDLNDHGEVVGAGFSPTKGRWYRPWSGTSLYDISDFDDEIPPSLTYPHRINNLGEISGFHSGYGPFFHNFLGFVDAYQDDSFSHEFEHGLELTFDALNDHGTNLGTYSLGGEAKVFLYQQNDPTLPGYFFFTDLPSEFSELPLGLNYHANDVDAGDINITDFTFTGYSDLNEYGEFANVFEAQGSMGTLYQGIQFFDGEFSWDLIDPTTSSQPIVKGINDWPQIVFSYIPDGGGEKTVLFHDHLTAFPEDLSIKNSSGSIENFVSGARFIKLSNAGHVLVKGQLPGDTADHYYLIELDQDSDSDGLPDDWETVHSVSDAAGNPDGDAFNNYQEFLYNLDPHVFDEPSDSASLAGGGSVVGNDDDGDGIPNTVETFWGLDLADSTDAGWDADGDGLSNLEEFLAGTSALSMDTDRDGMLDSEELEAGTDPTRSDIAQALQASSLVMLTPLQ